MMTIALLNHDHDTGRTFVFALPLVATIESTGGSDLVTAALADAPNPADTTFGAAIKHVLELCKEDTAVPPPADEHRQDRPWPTGGRA